MKTTHTILALAVASLIAYAAPSLADTINTTPSTCNVLTTVPAGALAYMGAGRFERTINREVQSDNPKNFPFRVTANTSVTVNIAALAPDPNAGWPSNRPALFDLQYLNASGTWVTACSGATNGTTSCTKNIPQGNARVLVSTTQGGTNVNNNKSSFTLKYNFAGPTNAAEAQNAVSTTSTSGQILHVNNTTKALITSNSQLPGVFEGQGVKLEITRSDSSVITEPNGPKLKQNDSPQADGTDFICSNWYGPNNEFKTCEVLGTATSDSTIHMPFQIQYGTNESASHYANVTVRRQFVNGYTQTTDTSSDFVKNCY